MEKKLSLKKLTQTIRSLATNRGRMMRLIGAIVAVVLLCAILSGLLLIQFTPNYPASGENPPQVAPNSQTNSTVPSQVVPNYQTSSTNSTSSTSSTISNVGSLKTIGIGAYWDDNLTNRVNGINWGLLEPGDQKSFLIYLHNEGNSAVTLSESTSNWNPSAAATYLTLSWDYNGQAIEAEKNLQVTLTLSVSANITGITTFSFDIIVVGTG